MNERESKARLIMDICDMKLIDYRVECGQDGVVKITIRGCSK